MKGLAGEALAHRARSLKRELTLDLVLAFREVTRRKRRSAVAVGSVAFGVVAMVLFSGFIEWIFSDMRESTIRSGLGHIQITRPGYLESGLSDPLAFLLPDNSPEMAAVEQLPEVKTVAPRITFYGLISRGEATLSFQGEGIRPDREQHLSTALIYAAGQPLATNAENEVLLGQGLADNLGARVGDLVVLLVNTPGGGINATEATVKGVFSTITKAYDDVAVRLPLPLAQRLLRIHGSTKWLVLLKDTAQTGTALDSLNSKLAGRPVSVLPWTLLADFYNKTVVLFSKQVTVLKLIIVVIVVLAIANSMTITVMERTGEIGTALALGASRRVIQRRFLVEGFALGLSGAIIGLAIGAIAAQAISSIGIPMPPAPGMGRGYIGQIILTPRLMFEAFVLAIASAVVAAIVPALRASRMSIVDAIRQGR
jgi:putative ABC transport system permease protein